MRVKGTLVEWNDDRGFGFVEAAGGGARAFCHISQFAFRSRRRPMVGERVTYELSRDERGRLRAAQIQPVTAPRRPKEERTPLRMSPCLAVFFSVMFLSILAGMAITGRLPWIVPIAYVVASVMALVTYALDKSAAMKGRWRTQESTLHLLALLGGWPGAWISQLLFRHKTRKGSFIASFVLSVLLNLAAVTWMVLEPQGPLGQLVWKIERP